MEQVTYKIGEAANLLNLKTYVLRFWETEFSQIAPLRTEKGQRLYTEKDITLLKRIRFLLHERGLTIEGVRKILLEESVGKKGKDTPLVTKNFLTQSSFFPSDHAESFFESPFSPPSASMATNYTDEGVACEEERLLPTSYHAEAIEKSDLVKAPKDTVSDDEILHSISLNLATKFSEKKLRQDVIDELEDVAAMLRHSVKTGSYLP